MSTSLGGMYTFKSMLKQNGYFAVRAKDEYPYVGQTCSIESAGGFGGEKS